MEVTVKVGNTLWRLADLLRLRTTLSRMRRKVRKPKVEKAPTLPAGQSA